MVPQVQPKTLRNPATKVQNIFAHRKGKSVLQKPSSTLPSLEPLANPYQNNSFHARHSSINQRTLRELSETEKVFPLKTLANKETTSNYSGIMYASPSNQVNPQLGG